jgi:hypothetical protein
MKNLKVTITVAGAGSSKELVNPTLNEMAKYLGADSDVVLSKLNKILLTKIYNTIKKEMEKRKLL